VYLGTQPAIGQNRKLDSIAASFNGVLTTFSLAVNTQSVVPSNVYQLFISLGGVLQDPGVDFTANGNQITFTTAPVSGLSFFGVFQGDSITGTPTIADASITTLKLATGLTITNTAGTAGAPSVTFAGDTNTGIYSPGADQVAISTGGSGRLFVDASGNIGVGAAPSAVTFGGLDVRSGGLGLVLGADSGAATRTDATTKLGRYLSPHYLNAEEPVAALIASNDSTESIVSIGGGTGLANAATTVRFFTAANNTTTSGAERLRITSAGLVGIGVSAPAELLHISGTANPSIQLSATNDTTPILNWASNGSDRLRISSSSVVGANINVRSNQELQLSTNNTERVRITNGGLVGIGVTAPEQLLHIGGNNGIRFGNAASTPKADISYTSSGDEFLDIKIQGTTTGYGNIRFSTGPTPSERARIDSSGRLLVGTSTSLSSYGINGLLNVASNGLLARDASFSYFKNDIYGPILTLAKSRSDSIGTFTYPTSGDLLGTLAFSGAHTGNGRFDLGVRIDGYANQTWTSTAQGSYLTFSTTADGASSPTERMRITSGGETIIKGSGTTSGTFALTTQNSSATLHFRVRDDGFLYMGLGTNSPYNVTTASAANANLDSNGYLYRSTSSIKYKTDVETLGDNYADAILGCRPVWYRSTTSNDNPGWGYWGFIAEEIAEIDPRLVSWKTCELQKNEDGTEEVVQLATPEPEGVQYDRFVPHLLNLIKRQQQAIETLEAKVTALESQ